MESPSAEDARTVLALAALALLAAVLLALAGCSSAFEVEPSLAPGQAPFEPDEIRSLTIELE